MHTGRIARTRSSILRSSLAAIVLLSATLFAQTGAYVSFDAPGAGTGQNEGTFSTSINRQGWIGGTVTGNYTDANGAAHGWVGGP